jgi:hypothetical protein
MEDNQVLSQWNEVKALIEAVELDVHKNAKGTAAAGVRARKGLRDIKNRVATLIKTTVELDKASKTAKP